MYIPDICKEKVELNQDERNYIFFTLLKMKIQFENEENEERAYDLKIIESIIKNLKGGI